MSPEEIQARIDAIYQPVLDQVTEEFLRPALLAAGIEDPERYKLAWVTEEPAPDPVDLYVEAPDEP